MEYKRVAPDKFQPEQQVQHLGDGTLMTIVRKDRTKADESYVCRWTGEHGCGSAGIFTANLLAAVDKPRNNEFCFDVGDVVMLNSGGMKMTVSDSWRVGDSNIHVECAWVTTDGESMTDTFDVRMLQYGAEE